MLKRKREEAARETSQQVQDEQVRHQGVMTGKGNNHLTYAGTDEGFGTCPEQPERTAAEEERKGDRREEEEKETQGGDEPREVIEGGGDLCYFVENNLGKVKTAEQRCQKDDTDRQVQPVAAATWSQRRRDMEKVRRVVRKLEGIR